MAAAAWNGGTMVKTLATEWPQSPPVPPPEPVTTQDELEHSFHEMSVGGAYTNPKRPFVVWLLEYVLHACKVCLWLGGWAVQLIVAAGPIRLIRWVWLAGRIIGFTSMMLCHVFLPMVWWYCTSGTILRHVPYHNIEESKGRSVLDIYLPNPAYAHIVDMSRAKKKRPVVIFFVGGAWIVGYKAWGALLSRMLAAAGCICFTPDYRNFPQATMSEMLMDYEKAIAWVVDHVDLYGGDVNNITVIGQSAGAQLTLTTMLRNYVATLHYAHRNRNQPLPQHLSHVTKILCAKAFVGISGPYDLVGMIDYFETRGLYRDVTHVIFEHLKMLLPTPEELALGQERGGDPISGVHGYSPVALVEEAKELLGDASHASLVEACGVTFPAVFLFHGTTDKSVPFASSVMLSEKLQEAGFCSSYKLMPGWSHTAPIIEGPFVDSKYPACNVLRDVLRIVSAPCAHSTGSGQINEQGFHGNVMPSERDSTFRTMRIQKAFAEAPGAPEYVLQIARFYNPF
eukprot:TRINITY_DN22268_c0_g1_i4.p1 TRINITY_DN22268_c0_g1~~TRINITY_DN22268_c0_g1_i4.p1  ORF type:complete len:511 (+),score=179.68 TRINITY_DN22268_c0_g1_i4:92-1624(+)